MFLQRHRVRCDAIALTAPMFGIVIRLPSFMVRHILDWAEGHQRIREDYAIGTGQWRALPFGMNALTHSRQRYQRNLRFYADEPQLRVGGPTWHWVREGILAGEQVLAGASDDATPTLLIQAEEERVVDNRTHDRFVKFALRRDTLVKGENRWLLKARTMRSFLKRTPCAQSRLTPLLNFSTSLIYPAEIALLRG
ncbi:lysophospholipase L2 [Salmonella enterica subsp. arizonae]|uniref:Lysophospholipase L2 n=1 Tax=Salmonella enterica subsp. arizonae TaxID=59203 RepID=A0A2X4WMK7_SALER|nr:lysophospholipase L2 [Salmonella enterica subsp. arizonae]